MLQGTLPPGWGNMTGMALMTFEQNWLEGTLPSEWFNMDKLVIVYCSPFQLFHVRLFTFVVQSRAFSQNYFDCNNFDYSTMANSTDYLTFQSSCRKLLG